MQGFYKWIVGFFTALILFFGGFYVNSTVSAQRDLRADQQTTVEQLLTYEQRISILEESKRNTEYMLRDIQSDLKRITNVIIK